MKLTDMIDQLTEILKIYGDLDVYLHDSNYCDDYERMSICVYEGYKDEEPEVNIHFNSKLDLR